MRGRAVFLGGSPPAFFSLGLPTTKINHAYTHPKMKPGTQSFPNGASLVRLASSLAHLKISHPRFFGLKRPPNLGLK